MALVKTAEEIEILREGGKRLARIIDTVAKAVTPGVSTGDLEDLTRALMAKGADTPAFLGYRPEGARQPYPAALCVSINNEAVHGVPNRGRIIKEGDVVSLDSGLIHRGLITDMCVTVGAGAIDAAAKRLIDATRECTYAGIAVARGGARLGDIGAAIEESIAPTGFSIVADLGGHGVGHAVHEKPHIFHIGTRGEGQALVPGMVITIEPTISEGGGDIEDGSDGFSYVTTDGSRTAQFEHTIVITDGDPEILTVV